MKAPVDICMTLIRRVFAAALLTIAATNPAPAADPVFPPGARVGMVPLVGLNRAKAFIGFETEDQGVKVVVADLPAEAYKEVSTAFQAAPGGTGGIKPESIETAGGARLLHGREPPRTAPPMCRRYSMIVPGIAFSGYVAVQVRKTPEDLQRRCGAPDVRDRRRAQGSAPDEQLGLLPFKVSELGEFKNVRTLAPGAAVIIADGDETKGFEAAPFMIIGVIGQTAAPRRIAAASPSRSQRPFPAFATAASPCPSRSASTASRLRDADRCDQRQGQYARHHRAVAALRLGVGDAHHRQFAARSVGQGISALPRRARWNPAARLMIKSAGRAEKAAFVCMQTLLAFRATSSRAGGHHVGSTTGCCRSRRDGVRGFAFGQGLGGGINQAG
jgi:hypothetical protein